MKDKIATITFHRALNCGAVLQTYALQKYINKLKKDSEVIDYRCKKIENSYRLFQKTMGIKSTISLILYLPIRLVKKHKFNKFKREYLKVSKKCSSDNELKMISQEYKSIIVGSDQVWNLEITGQDMAYFLDFCNDDKRIAYAASVGNYTSFVEKQELYKKDLSNFKGISVREKTVSDQLSNSLGREIHTVVDPVFLLNKEEWESMIQKKTEKSPYVFAYCLHEKKVYEETKRIADNKHIPIVCVPSNLRCPIKGKIIRTMGPIEFLSRIKNAEYVVTDSFHAVAFSIIFNKKFIPVLKSEYKELNERIISLIDLCGLNALFSQKEYFYEQFDYSDVNRRLKVEIDKSKLFLQKYI